MCEKKVLSIASNIYCWKKLNWKESKYTNEFFCNWLFFIRIEEKKKEKMAKGIFILFQALQNYLPKMKLMGKNSCKQNNSCVNHIYTNCLHKIVNAFQHQQKKKLRKVLHKK